MANGVSLKDGRTAQVNVGEGHTSEQDPAITLPHNSGEKDVKGMRSRYKVVTLNLALMTQSLFPGLRFGVLLQSSSSSSLRWCCLKTLLPSLPSEEPEHVYEEAEHVYDTVQTPAPATAPTLPSTKPPATSSRKSADEAENYYRDMEITKL